MFVIPLEINMLANPRMEHGMVKNTPWPAQGSRINNLHLL